MSHSDRHVMTLVQRGRECRERRCRRRARATSRAAVEQRAPDLERRGVEGERRRTAASRRPASARPNDASCTRRDDAAVGDRHALGPAGRARGVDHVGEVVGGPRGGRGCPHARAGSVAPRRVQAEAHHAFGSRQPVDAVGAGRAAPRRRASASMKARRSRRVVGIERHVGAAGLEDRQQRDDHARASGRGRRRPRVSAPTPEPRRWCASRLARAFELAVGQPTRPRTPPRPRRACAAPAPRSSSWTAASDGYGRRRVVPLDEELPALGGGEQRQRRRCAAPGSAPTPSEQRREVRRPAARSSPPSKRSRAVLERRRSSPSGLSRSEQRQVELRRSRCQRQRRDASSPGSARAALRRVLQRRTSPGRAASWLRLAVRRELLDQPLEGQVLVGVGAERDARARAAAARGRSGRPARSVRSTRVLTKKPISASSLGPGAVRRSGVPTDEVVLPGVAGQQRLEGGEQRHEERRALAPAQRPQRPRRARAAASNGMRARRGASAPAGAGGRSAARARRGAPAELLPPVGELRARAPRRAARRAARRRSRRTGSAAAASGEARSRGEGGVERGELAHEDAHRPAVGDDVVQRQRAATCSSPASRSSARAQQRAAREVERRAAPPRRTSRCAAALPRGLAAAPRGRPRLSARHGGCGDELHRLAVRAARNVVRSASWRGTIASRRRAKRGEVERARAGAAPAGTL